MPRLQVHQDEQLVHQQDDCHCCLPTAALRGTAWPSINLSLQAPVCRSLAPLFGEKDVGGVLM